MISRHSAPSQIQLKEFDRAHASIARIREWLDGDFKRYFDQDSLETFPDYESKYFILSAQLAEAEGKAAGALALYQKVIANPFYRRAYPGYVKSTQQPFERVHGSAEGWDAFSKVPALPPGVPSGYMGTSFLPWVSLNFKLPDASPIPPGKAKAKAEAEAKATMVYIWASPCGSCPHLSGIQTLYNRIKDRPDIQLVTFSMEEDPAKLAAFMKEKSYTFPAIAARQYVENLLPHPLMEQRWILDRNSIRLERSAAEVIGRDQAYIDEAIYELTQIASLRK